MSIDGLARRIAPTIVAGAVLLTLACGSESTPAGPDSPGDPDPPGETDPDDDEETGDPSGVLECRIVGFPCSLSEVDVSVLERSDALADEALAMLDDDASMVQVAQWLGGQEGMAEVEGDDAAIRFRLVGGRGMWVFAGGALIPAEPPDAEPVAARTFRPSAPAKVVVAKESQGKRALVLSPFLWAFGEHDDGAAVAEILADTRGYANGVTFTANDEQASQNVGVASFEGWEGYQVIHVSSHGKRLCTEAGCRAVIFAGTLPDGPESPAKRLHELAHQGVEASKSNKHPGVIYLALTADFFRNEYPNGVEDAVVFFNACQTFGLQATDLANAVQGSTSVLFGWDQAVFSSDATAAAVALYRDLSERGYPAEIAYDNLAELQHGRPNDHSPGGARLIMGERPVGGDLRIREVVYVLDPTTGTVLTPSDEVPIEGTQGDGEPDAVPWVVQIDGVKPELAHDMVVHFSVDGEEGEPVDLLDALVDGMDRWTVTGVAPLGYDLEEAKQVTFRAWVNLHDEGESQHQTPAILTGDEPIMGVEWEFEATQVSYWTAGAPGNPTPYTATATLTLAFEEGQQPNEPHPRYVVTGGTVTYDYNHRYGSCTFTAPILTYEVTEEHTTSAQGSHASIVFNTTTNPVTYTAVLHTQGPEFVYTAACELGTSEGTHRATNTWLLANPGEERPVSADRNALEGTYLTGTSFPSLGYDFVVESTYSAERVR